MEQKLHNNWLHWDMNKIYRSFANEKKKLPRVTKKNLMLKMLYKIMQENCSIWQCRRTLKISIEDLKSSENSNKILTCTVYAIKTNNKNKKNWEFCFKFFPCPHSLWQKNLLNVNKCFSRGKFEHIEAKTSPIKALLYCKISTASNNPNY